MYVLPFSILSRLRLAVPPSEFHRRLPNNDRSAETTTELCQKKRRRISSLDEPTASSCKYSSRTSRNERIQTSPHGPVRSAAVLRAIANVESAKDFVREALLIQSNANAMVSKAMAALMTQPDDDDGNPLTAKREAALSASSFASLAQAKSLRSRAVLEEALANLSKVQNASMADVQTPMELPSSEADDTANSSCKSPQHDSNRSSEDSGTSVEVPASDTCGSSGTPVEVSGGMEHHHTRGQRADNVAFSNVNIFETYGVDKRGLVLDEGHSAEP